MIHRRRVVVVAGILLLSFARASAQKPCPATGKLDPDYKNLECTVGDLDFKFGDTTKNAFAKVTTVKPTADTQGLNFTFPPQQKKGSLDDALPPMITYDLSIAFQVKGMKKRIAEAGISGKVAPIGNDLLVAADMVLGPPDDAKAQEKLILQTFTAVTVSYAQAVQAGVFINVKNDFNVHTGKGGPGAKDELDDAAEKTLTFTDAFVSAK